MNKPNYPSDIEIARKANKLPIEEVADRLNIPHEHLEHHGKHKAKIDLDYFQSLSSQPNGKMVLVTSINPTPAGEGKTTTTIGLGDALNRIGKPTTVCLREPSLGPCFGMKGGAAGGGYAQVVPMEDINLHFTGDFHAIGLAHNLLAAAIDNNLHFDNALNIDPRRISWNRVMDMNDRALRDIVIGLGGPTNSLPRETGFEITAASEVMAILCLAQDFHDLKKRLGNITIGHDRNKQPVFAHQLDVHGAMTVLLRDALKPNLVQTLENNPALIHGGPFANIAHGCNSVIATQLAMKVSQYTITEAGFGADLGAEKFFNIKCRKAGLKPDGVVLVATIRALKYHGGVEVADLATPNLSALEKGLQNLKRHIENIHKFGLPVVVALNTFVTDSIEELQLVRDKCDYLGVRIVPAEHWLKGSEGTLDLAEAVVDMVENKKSDFSLLYPDDMTLWNKAETVAREIYGADEILADKRLRDKFRAFQEGGFGHLPVCMAKTQYSFSTDPKLRNRPRNFGVPLRDIKLASGAEFLVVLTGEIMTMPGLPKIPAANQINIDEDGQVVGLF